MATAKASAGKKVIRRRRERKNIERGQVHIRSSFNNTMVTVTEHRATRSPGLPPAASVSAAARSPPPSRHRPRLRRPPAPLWSMA